MEYPKFISKSTHTQAKLMYFLSVSYVAIPQLLYSIPKPNSTYPVIANYMYMDSMQWKYIGHHMFSIVSWSERWFSVVIVFLQVPRPRPLPPDQPPSLLPPPPPPRPPTPRPSHRLHCSRPSMVLPSLWPSHIIKVYMHVQYMYIHMYRTVHRWDSTSPVCGECCPGWFVGCY